jgi:hypothetical protein
MGVSLWHPAIILNFPVTSPTYPASKVHGPAQAFQEGILPA